MKSKIQHEKEILEIIEVEKLFTIQDIFAFYKGIKNSQFYNLELDKSEAIKSAIEKNKRTVCQTLKNRWFKSENPTLQLALFKTICSDEERRSLSMTHNEITGADGEALNRRPIMVQSEQAKKDLEKLT